MKDANGYKQFIVGAVLLSLVLNGMMMLRMNAMEEQIEEIAMHASTKNSLTYSDVEYAVSSAFQNEISVESIVTEYDTNFILVGPDYQDIEALVSWRLGELHKESKLYLVVTQDFEGAYIEGERISVESNHSLKYQEKLMLSGSSNYEISLIVDEGEVEKSYALGRLNIADKLSERIRIDSYFSGLETENVNVTVNVENNTLGNDLLLFEKGLIRLFYDDILIGLREIELETGITTRENLQVINETHFFNPEEVKNLNILDRSDLDEHLKIEVELVDARGIKFRSCSENRGVAIMDEQ